MPLAQTIWPEVSPEDDFLTHTLSLVDNVRTAVGSKGIIVADRSADHPGLLVPWTEDPCNRFIVRLRLHTELLFNRRILTASELAATCDTPYGKHVVRVNVAGDQSLVFIDFGHKPVRLPAVPDRSLSLVVVRGFVPEPVVLLTTEPLRENRAVLTDLVAAYCMRWRVVSTKLRFQERHRLSDIRVLSYERIRNLTTLLHALEYMHALDTNDGHDRVFDDTHIIDEGIDPYRSHVPGPPIRRVSRRVPSSH